MMKIILGFSCLQFYHEWLNCWSSLPYDLLCFLHLLLWSPPYWTIFSPVCFLSSCYCSFLFLFKLLSYQSFIYRSICLVLQQAWFRRHFPCFHGLVALQSHNATSKYLSHYLNFQCIMPYLIDKAICSLPQFKNSNDYFALHPSKTVFPSRWYWFPPLLSVAPSYNTI